MVLNNQPQGGLAMRERPQGGPPMRERPNSDRVADHNGWDGGFFGLGHGGSWDSQYASMRQRGGQNYYPREW